MSQVQQLRMHLQQARTRLAKFGAAPDRWRRSRSARGWLASNDGDDAARRAVAAVAADGFSPYALGGDLQQRLLTDWRALKEQRANGKAAEVSRTTGKLFFNEMLSDDDLRRFPAFIDTALDERLLTIVLQAMGMVPHLESIDILASVHDGSKLSASQLWHYDVNDTRIVKLFVYLEDCGPRNGPFTFIPAGSSQRVSSVVGHYVSDERIAEHVPREQWQAVEGPTGTAFLIDTGRCYHFGSRSELTRYAYVVTYSSGLKFMKRARLWTGLLAQRASGLSRLQRMVCGLPE